MFTIRRFTVLLAGGLLALALLVAACSNKAEAPTDGEGGETPADAAEESPVDGAGETPPAGETPDGETPDDGGPPFELAAQDFGDGDDIPTSYTCDGVDTSPALNWSGAPADTQAFALIVDDPDAPAGVFVHWVLYDLPGSETLLEAAIPLGSQPQAGGAQGRNDFGRTGWGGPCPPEGETHDYVFTLYALSEELGLDPGATKDEVLAAAEGKTLATAEMIATYGR